jgi:ethylmalonyl-CoA mutase
VVGLSVLSGAHLAVVPEVLTGLRDAGVHATVVVGGIVPPDDARALTALGVRAVFTPKDYELGAIMSRLLELVASGRRERVTA